MQSKWMGRVTSAEQLATGFRKGRKEKSHGMGWGSSYRSWRHEASVILSCLYISADERPE